MLYLLRLLVKLACLALVFAFIFSIGLAWLFANPSITSFSQIIHAKHITK